MLCDNFDIIKPLIEYIVDNSYMFPLLKKCENRLQNDRLIVTNKLAHVFMDHSVYMLLSRNIGQLLVASDFDRS